MKKPQTSKPKKPEWLKSKPPKSKRITLDFIQGKTDKPNETVKK